MPAAASAGANGRCGGASQTMRRPAADRLARAGSMSCSSPPPSTAVRISVNAPLGHPLLGKCLSNIGNPVDTTGMENGAVLPPRHTRCRRRRSSRGRERSVMILYFYTVFMVQASLPARTKRKRPETGFPRPLRSRVGKEKARLLANRAFSSSPGGNLPSRTQSPRAQRTCVRSSGTSISLPRSLPAPACCRGNGYAPFQSRRHGRIRRQRSACSVRRTGW